MTIKQNLENKEQKISLIAAGVLIAALLGKIDCTYCSSTKEEPIKRTGPQLIETDDNNQQKVVHEKERTKQNAHISALGITLKKTTKSEIAHKFSIIEIGYVNGFPGYEVVWLDTKNLSLGDMSIKKAGIIVNPQGVTEQITLIFNGKVFHKLNSILSKKYPLKSKEEPFVGDCSARYETKDDVVFLEQPHMGGFVTHLVYLSKEMNDVAEAYNQKEKKQTQQEIENQL